MPLSPKTTLISVVSAAVIGLGLASTALSDGFKGHLVVTDPVTKKECGDCHMAYPAALLSPEAWGTLMNDLPNHFGEDASLNEEKRAHIENYLTSNTKWRTSNTTLRISEQKWFTHEHKRYANSKSFAKAKSWANCQVCHRGAEQGYYDDD